MIRSIARIFRSNDRSSEIARIVQQRPASWPATAVAEPTNQADNHVIEAELVDGVPKESRDRHVAVVFKPAPTPTQAGKSKYNMWRIKFPPSTGEKLDYYNPLMGWTSTVDPMNMVTVDFGSKEDAIAFAQRNGWTVEVEEPHEFLLKPKNYGDNFKWQKPPRSNW